MGPRPARCQPRIRRGRHRRRGTGGEAAPRPATFGTRRGKVHARGGAPPPCGGPRTRHQRDRPTDTAEGGDPAAWNPPLDRPRPGRDQSSLRRRQRVLPAGARPGDDVLVCSVRLGRHDARGGTGRQARAHLPQTRPHRPDVPRRERRAATAAARCRVRVGLDGHPRREPARRRRRRRDHQRRAGDRGPSTRRGSRPRRSRRDPAPGLPARRRRALRRDLVDRDGRTRRREEPPEVLRRSPRVAPPGRTPPQPRDLQGRRLQAQPPTVHLPVRVPRRRTGRRRRSTRS